MFFQHYPSQQRGSETMNNYLLNDRSLTFLENSFYRFWNDIN